MSFVSDNKTLCEATFLIVRMFLINTGCSVKDISKDYNKVLVFELGVSLSP